MGAMMVFWFVICLFGAIVVMYDWLRESLHNDRYMGRYTWLRKLVDGDDGKDYCVCAEPSMFRARESSVNGPFTRRQAFKFARQYVAANPYGLCEITSHKHPMNWP